ncbi:MAG: hypothetical protein K2G17_07575, partial [Duncaniella sp.]|nr:hypothetical protein [Duncaniella sp.]
MKIASHVATISIATIISASAACAATPATVSISNRSGQKIYFQPESSLNYSEVMASDTLIT